MKRVERKKYKLLKYTFFSSFHYIYLKPNKGKIFYYFPLSFLSVFIVRK